MRRCETRRRARRAPRGVEVKRMANSCVGVGECGVCPCGEVADFMWSTVADCA